MKIKNREELIAKQEEYRASLNSQRKQILICAGTGCVAGGSLEIYAKMKDSKELPKTFCPSPENFCKEYQCEEDKIIVIALSSKLSGTYNSASLARDLYLSEHKEKDIRVIDSMTGSIGAGLLLIKAAKMISEGKDIDEIVEAIENLKGKYTILIIAHRLSTVINSDKIYVINKGTVEGVGTHKELLKTCKIYADLYKNEDNKSK